MKRICVFCGSSPGASPAYTAGTRALAHALVNADIGLVYGGAHLGLMGVLADTVLEAGGDVIGVIPRSLVELEIAHTRLTDLRVVETMHERKALMADLSDGFIALPGGMGTLEEMFEILTWGQLGMHGKPCGLLDIDGYYTSLLTFLDHMLDQRFLRPEHRAVVLVDTEPTRLLAQFATFQAPPTPKWVDRSQT